MSELPEKDISNVVGSVYIGSILFVSELSEKYISKVVVQCRKYSTISCRGLCLNYLKKISQTWWFSVGNILQ